MTFGASAKRARSDAFPLGLRVACLHECIEQFNLFGFQSTRLRLMARFGVSRGEWTPAQINEAVDLLEAARQSWVHFLTGRQQQQRVARTGNRTAPPLDQGAVKVEWLGQYLQGHVAREWLVVGLGDCVECGHPLLLHGSWACAGCSVDPNVEWDARCRVQFPPPAGG